MLKSAKEKQSYDRLVKVMYQEKAWCDKEIMKEWISTECINLLEIQLAKTLMGKFWLMMLIVRNKPIVWKSF